MFIFAKEKEDHTTISKTKDLLIEPSVPDDDGIRISAPNMKDSIYVPKSYDENNKISMNIGIINKVFMDMIKVTMQRYG